MAIFSQPINIGIMQGNSPNSYMVGLTMIGIIGVAKETVTTMMAIGGLIEIPLRILNGFLYDREIVAAFTQYTIATFIAGLSALSCAVFKGLPGRVVFSLTLCQPYEALNVTS